MPTIRKRGNVYQVQVRLKKQGTIIFQESATFPTQREAKAWGYALESKIKRHGVSEYKAAGTTVSDLVLAWQEAKEKIKPVSKGLQHSVGAIMKSPFAHTPVSVLKPKDITQWAISLHGYLNPSTILHHLMVLRSAFSSAKALQDIDASVDVVADAAKHLRHLKVTAKSASRDTRVSDAEIDLIVQDFMGRFMEIPMHVIVPLLVALPRRREEMLTACWSNYTGKTLTLIDTKNPNMARNEVIPVPPKAKVIIDALPRIDARILPYKPESVSAAFQRCVRRLGLQHIRLHDLRHEGISRLFEEGLAIQEVALISGHLNWAMLRRYTHLKPNDVLEKLNARSERT